MKQRASRNPTTISDEEADETPLIKLYGKGRKDDVNDDDKKTDLSGGGNIKVQFPSTPDHSDEDNAFCHRDRTSHKRKRAANVIVTSSHSETDSDDHIPLSRRLRTKSKQKKNDDDNTSSSDGNHRPAKMRPRLRRIAANMGSEEEGESETEGGSNLGGFIVGDCDVSVDLVSTDVWRSQAGRESGDDEAYSDINYRDIINRIGRVKDRRIGNWENQAELQADLGKDPESCMKAVCALYRLQTPDEKMFKETFSCNGQGFSQTDATWGTELGEFLTAGDPEGDLSKSEQESSMMGKALMGVGGWHSSMQLSCSNYIAAAKIHIGVAQNPNDSKQERPSLKFFAPSMGQVTLCVMQC